MFLGGYLDGFGRCCIGNSLLIYFYFYAVHSLYVLIFLISFARMGTIGYYFDIVVRRLLDSVRTWYICILDLSQIKKYNRTLSRYHCRTDMAQKLLITQRKVKRKVSEPIRGRRCGYKTVTCGDNGLPDSNAHVIGYPLDHQVVGLGRME